MRLCSNVGCQVAVHVSNGMMFGLIFLPSAMELDRVQFSRHFSLLSTWMTLPKCSPVLYADGILLIAPSVCEVNKLLQSVERELIELNMAINANKSCS